MQKNAVIAVKLAGSAWLLFAAFVAATLAVIGLPRGPYAATLVLAVTAFWCLAGIVFFWRAKPLHWLSISAVVLSVGLSLFGRALVE